jgi:hypothetical protein
VDTSDWLHARSAGTRRRRWVCLAAVAMLVAALPLTGAGPATGVEVLGINVPTCVPVPDLGITCPGNVALNAIVYSSGHLPCTLRAGAGNVVDGAASNIYYDKWCVPSGQPTIYIQLLNNGLMGYSVDKIVVKHAGVAERTSWNTRAFRITAYNGIGSRTFAEVKDNTASVSTHVPGLNVPAYNNIREIRLDVLVPTQGTNTATRIYEVEVWARPSTTLP